MLRTPVQLTCSVRLSVSIKFIPAKELKQQYSVLGHFYLLQMQGCAPEKCRSVLEIKAKTVSSNSKADAVFVMMNPGSSKPLEDILHKVSPVGISEMSARLVPTAPDTTQYQVMRVMYYSGWKNVRVINLSDLRNPKGSSFSKQYTELELKSGSTVHSIFSSQRSAELARHLSRQPNAPVVCAWGVSNSLSPLIERASAELAAESSVVGLEKPGHDGKFFHPLPSLQHHKEQWVVQMLDLLNAKPYQGSAAL